MTCPYCLARPRGCNFASACRGAFGPGVVFLNGLHVSNALAGCKVLKSENRIPIDRWTLDFDLLKHKARDPESRCQPEIALRFLSSNYPADTVEQILNRLADPDRGRLVVLCLSCEPFVRDGNLHVSAHDQNSPRARLCDYAVDPVTASSDGVRERWQEHAADAGEQVARNMPQSGYVLGRSVHEFAPAVGALSDGEEMVAPGST